MKNQKTAQSGNSGIGMKRAPYEAPAIIYEGLITTRAGSQPQRPESDGGGGGGADPANVFGKPGG